MVSGIAFAALISIKGFKSKWRIQGCWAIAAISISSGTAFFTFVGFRAKTLNPTYLTNWLSIYLWYIISRLDFQL